MKNTKIKPTRSQLNILRQICNFIPAHEVSKIARATGAQDKSRTFDPWSHVVSLLYGQLAHSIGLNDLCNSLGAGCMLLGLMFWLVFWPALSERPLVIPMGLNRVKPQIISHGQHVFALPMPRDGQA